MAHPMIKCPTCDGHGDVAMGEELYEVFSMIGLASWLPTSKIAEGVNAQKEQVAVSLTAICNRLAKLKRLGMVVSRRRGKALEWRRT